MTRKTFAIIALAAVAGISLALFAAGCGKKTWPAPKAVKERFHWVFVKGTLDKGCLRITARMDGAWRNLDELILEVANPETECPGCPFSPSERLEFPPESPQILRNGEDLELVYCGDQPRPPYRFRLVGRNIYGVLGDAASEVATAEETQPVRQ